MSAIRVGVTGAKGFIGQHLVKQLQQDERFEAVEATRDTFASSSALVSFVRQCDCVVHLAGMNRGDEEQIYGTNLQITESLVEAIEVAKSKPHVIFASSTHRDRDSAYGRSKADCEARFNELAGKGAIRLTNLVIPGVFGPGGKPFYNSVVATFCYQIASGDDCVVNADSELSLISVHALVERIAELAAGQRVSDRLLINIPPMANITVSELHDQLQRWKTDFDQDNVVPDLSDSFDAHLYATLLSYIRPEGHTHEPTVHVDDRGRLFEIIKLANGGQVFFSTTKPGVIRGNHYHTRKIEWFCVLQGCARISLRAVNSDEVHEFNVSGEKPQFVSIPALYTHNIENTGDEDLLTMFWCNEIFDATNPDTIYEKVA